MGLGLTQDQTVLLAFFILFVGIFLLLLPLLLEAHHRWLRFMDAQILPIIIGLVLVGVFLVSAWAVWLAREEPTLLLPMGVFTILFRLVSPSVLAKEIAGRLGPPTARVSRVDQGVVAAGVVMGCYAFWVSLREALGWGQGGLGFESLVMTLAVIYSFSRFYLFIFWNQMKQSKVMLSWVAGMIIGVAFVLMVPEVLGAEYLIFFGLAGAGGWWLASTLLFLERHQRATRLLRLLRFD